MKLGIMGLMGLMGLVLLPGCSTLDRAPDPIDQAVAELIAQ